ncbi:M48 family metallopeptidase [Terrihabitans sp. B22-R8]|uniref:M48 family metallopeptidase n=1 Tax=Terrihabitans sp. B22-R8 TaxID=3425128 RepID=UPI00403D1AF0
MSVLRRLFTASRPRAPEPSRLEIRVGGQPLTIHVRRHPKARRITLRLRQARRDLVLTLPPRVSLKAAQAFAERQIEWIAARIGTLPETVHFVADAHVPVRGVPHRIVHAGARGLTRIEAGADGAPAIAVPGPPDHLARRVRDFLKAEARRDLERATAIYAAALDVSVGRISIKDTRTRWGSCSSSGALAFSWRLILAPSFVLDYVAAHEVAHRREMNHSARYWAVLRGLCPHTDEAEAWLKAHGASLHRYGPEPAIPAIPRTAV